MMGAVQCCKSSRNPIQTKVFFSIRTNHVKDQWTYGREARQHEVWKRLKRSNANWFAGCCSWRVLSKNWSLSVRNSFDWSLSECVSFPRSMASVGPSAWTAGKFSWSAMPKAMATVLANLRRALSAAKHDLETYGKISFESVWLSLKCQFWDTDCDFRVAITWSSWGNLFSLLPTTKTKKTYPGSEGKTATQAVKRYSQASRRALGYKCREQGNHWRCLKVLHVKTLDDECPEFFFVCVWR